MQDHSIILSCKQCNKSFSVFPSQAHRQFCGRDCFNQSRANVTKVCPICKKPFEVIRSRQLEVTYCGVACHGVAMRKWHTFICKQCKKPFEVPTWKLKDHPTWCSMDCVRAWNEAQGKSPRTKVCPQCGKEFPEKSTDKRHYCSQECHHNAEKDTRVTVQCEICGRLKEITPSKVRRFRFCCAECRWIWTTLNMPRISSIEVKMVDAFAQVGLAPQSQYVVGPFVADFAFPEEKLIVECDGDYWHNLPDVQKKDRIKNHYYWRNGWEVLRFWEHEINESPADCIKRVQAKLQSLTS